MREPKIFKYPVYIKNHPAPIDEAEINLSVELIHGDIVNFGTYRFACAYFIVCKSDEKSWVRNPDLSHRGYITIPNEVTENIYNTFDFYRNLIHTLDNQLHSIYLSNSDIYLEKFPMALVEKNISQNTAWYFGNTFMKDYDINFMSFIVYNKEDGFTQLEIEVKKKYMLKIEE